MAAKYSNDELAERVRSANRRRSITRREKLATAGKSALTVWVPVDLRQRFIATAEARQATISELATALIDAGLSGKTEIQLPTKPDAESPPPTTLDLFQDKDGEAPGTETTNPLPVSVLSVSEDPTDPFTKQIAGYREFQKERSALMAEVGKLLEEGLSGAAIARRFNDEGRRTTRGAAFAGNALLRDYRKYQTTRE